MGDRRSVGGPSTWGSTTLAVSGLQERGGAGVPGVSQGCPSSILTRGPGTRWLSLRHPKVSGFFGGALSSEARAGGCMGVTYAELADPPGPGCRFGRGMSGTVPVTTRRGLFLFFCRANVAAEFSTGVDAVSTVDVLLAAR